MAFECMLAFKVLSFFFSFLWIDLTLVGVYQKKKSQSKEAPAEAKSYMM